jgi:hypothetical protein
MSEPYWIALGAKLPIDYIGGWAAEVSYKPGDVVSHNGVEYIAVNPSTGVTPPAVASTIVGIGTSLPTSPTDGQEYILVNSLTAPTYSWRFRYVAGITDAYKWVFVGGAPLLSEIAVNETGTGAYGNLATVGPTITLPRAGNYLIGLGAHITNATGVGTPTWMSFAIGAAAAVDADGINWDGAYQPALSRWLPKNGLAAGVALVAKYRSNGTGHFRTRWLAAQPVRVS